MRGAPSDLVALDVASLVLRSEEKAMRERSETIHATFAPNAAMYRNTGMRFNIASTRIRYGRKQRRTMNSVCRPKLTSSPADRLSAFFCQTERYFSGCWPDSRLRPTQAVINVRIAPPKTANDNPANLVSPALRTRPMVIPAKVVT